MNHEHNESLLTFPCEYPIKVMGLAAEDFDVFVVNIVRNHGATIKEGAVSSRLSKNGQYVSVTVTLTAESRAQLELIYQELSSHQRVLMML
jgi:putative lipoic acid-binding regulatory protein